MAIIVCQGLQSCLESQVVEQRTMRLRLSSPKPQFSQPLELALKPCSFDSTTEELSDRRQDEDKHISSIPNPDMGGWSFLQALSNTSQGPEESMEKENTYVHPLIKRYPSTLSEKSLELCTENLGNENGTDTVEKSIFSLCSVEPEAGNSPTREQQKPRQLLGAGKANSRSFPPPLTTMIGSECLRVRPHREDGRLIIKAVKVLSTHAHFQTERSHGRLRLYIVKDSASNFDSTSEAKNEKEEIENDVNHDEEEDMGEEEEDEEEEKVEEENDYEEQVGKVNVAASREEEENVGYIEKEAEENHLNVEAEMGMENFQRSRRCKDGELEEKLSENKFPYKNYNITLWVR
ncbi:protein FANTASTIC FOUR 3-like isoform X2 [Hevea brasiliensis]|uniref:protein FANTASTIC FOUR 3-like isoform X2 n=1 Tax=Hevea brasiliensis TaxID=3981 RepID=UPI0025EB0096|nr:protein FANTASTIC FOUR 3-like isoform X2 [Hevea brasiliensis]